MLPFRSMQVPKPLNFFLGAQSDEKGVKQIIRLILSKFIRRQPGRSDSEWASMWRDMQYLREKAFPFLDLEYILIEFCRGLLKAGKFSLARKVQVLFLRHQRRQKTLSFKQLGSTFSQLQVFLVLR
jgi:hypothetical protein